MAHILYRPLSRRRPSVWVIKTWKDTGDFTGVFARKATDVTPGFLYLRIIYLASGSCREIDIRVPVLIQHATELA